jgi:hypothetical protein
MSAVMRAIDPDPRGTGTEPRVNPRIPQDVFSEPGTISFRMLLDMLREAHTGDVRPGGTDGVTTPTERRCRVEGPQPHTDDLWEAVARLAAAVELDPTNEAVAHHHMQALARIGDTAGVRAHFERLRRTLDELDEEPQQTP